MLSLGVAANLREPTIMKMSAWLSFRTTAGASAAFVLLAAAPSAWADRYAAIVFDANTNEVLHADQADEQRYPASLTKMMTLFILFDELERGNLSLDDSFVVSQRAAAQPPSRLGLRAGDRIRVEDAINALVTRSANDVAVVVAEALEGSESRFASRMTAKARALGMRSTRYVNASGLPDTGQVTTARDQLMLSQALLRDHPSRYRYFQTSSFSWRNAYFRNHNSLLGRVEGVDGIKTGYTRASGFNLASSAQRNGHRVFAVVMGGESAASRDAQMAYLIDNAFAQIEARAGGPGVPPAAVFTSLPINRVTVTLPPAPPSEPEDMADAELVTSRASVTVSQGDYDQPSYVVPFPYPARPSAQPVGAPGASMQIRGSTLPDGQLNSATASGHYLPGGTP
jgi:D-alanyl-D-alanine carboxypeptidase